MLTPGEKMLSKALVGSGLDSRGWNSIQAGLRDRAFFMSQVAELHIADAARRLTAEYADGHVDFSKLRIEWRNYLERADYQPDPEVAGTIKDLYTQARIDVVLKTNVAQARGFVQFAEGMTPGAFAAFPAQEFTRVVYRKRKRADWPRRWAAAGGKVHGGRMIALKDDPVWQRLGDAGPFGNPYPPFDWGSGMGVVDIDRKTAIELGVVTAEGVRASVDRLRDDAAQQRLPSMNGRLQAEVPYKGKTTEYKRLEAIFGDQITHDKGKVVWRANLIRDAFESGKPFRINLGGPTDCLKSMLPTDELRARLKGKAFTLNGDWLDKPRQTGGTHRAHFEPLEKDPRNIPLTPGDLDLVPSLWRKPHKVLPGGFPGSFVCQVETLDGGILNMVVDVKRTPVIHTLYKNKLGMGLGASLEQSSALQRMRHVQHAEPTAWYHSPLTKATRK